jgi:FKBP-type peptidyl-prolyl cis-trans isomerase 2
MEADMSQAKSGDRVKVHYTVKLEDGTVFDSSKERAPLELTLGDGKLIKGFEQAVLGMSPGEMKIAKVPSDDAYGPHSAEMMVSFERERLPHDLDPKVGQQLEIQRQDGRKIPAVVTEVSPAAIIVDANHPLAGKDLTFEIQLVEVV